MSTLGTQRSQNPPPPQPFFFSSIYEITLPVAIFIPAQMGTNWMAVVDKCFRGHYQPLLLLYANPNASALATGTAPQKTTMVPDPRQFAEEGEYTPLCQESFA